MVQFHQEDTLRSHKDHAWRKALPCISPERPRWRQLYSSPTYNRVGDLGWSIAHGTVTTNASLARFTDTSPECRFCGKVETVAHQHVECESLDSLFKVLKNILLRFSLHFSPTVLIFGYPKGDGPQHLQGLVNVLVGYAKLAMHRARKVALEGKRPASSLGIFRAPVGARVWLEFRHARLTHAVPAFKEQWAMEEAVCSVADDGELCMQL